MFDVVPASCPLDPIPGERKSAHAAVHSPKAVETRYRAMLRSSTDVALALMRTASSARFDALAVSAASELVSATKNAPRDMASPKNTSTHASTMERSIVKAEDALYGARA